MACPAVWGCGGCFRRLTGCGEPAGPRAGVAGVRRAGDGPARWGNYGGWRAGPPAPRSPEVTDLERNGDEVAASLTAAVQMLAALLGPARDLNLVTEQLATELDRTANALG